MGGLASPITFQEIAAVYRRWVHRAAQGGVLFAIALIRHA
jgi:hypothetical protein